MINDDLIKELRDPASRFIFQGGSEYARSIADALEAALRQEPVAKVNAFDINSIEWLVSAYADKVGCGSLLYAAPPATHDAKREKIELCRFKDFGTVWVQRVGDGWGGDIVETAWAYLERIDSKEG